MALTMEDGDVVVFDTTSNKGEITILQIYGWLLRPRICGYFRKNAICDVTGEPCAPIDCMVDDDILLEQDKYKELMEKMKEMLTIEQIYVEDLEKSKREEQLQRVKSKAL